MSKFTFRFDIDADDADAAWVRFWDLVDPNADVPEWDTIDVHCQEWGGDD